MTMQQYLCCVLGCSYSSELYQLMPEYLTKHPSPSKYCQVVELDFLYPSEGIHRRWESGYRITSTAATNDQAAFILSMPKRKPMDETQETLRTSAFPSAHVKVSLQPMETPCVL